MGLDLASGPAGYYSTSRSSNFSLEICPYIINANIAYRFSPVNVASQPFPTNQAYRIHHRVMPIYDSFFFEILFHFSYLHLSYYQTTKHFFTPLAFLGSSVQEGRGASIYKERTKADFVTLFLKKLLKWLKNTLYVCFVFVLRGILFARIWCAIMG